MVAGVSRVRADVSRDCGTAPVSTTPDAQGLHERFGFGRADAKVLERLP